MAPHTHHKPFPKVERPPIYEVCAAAPGEAYTYKPRGAARELICGDHCHDQQLIISGPRETGKTIAACVKAHLIACKYPGAQGVICRKTYADMSASVLQTFNRVIVGAPCTLYGGEARPEFYKYHNGSKIWVCGMDNPGKALSSERDFIYPNQVEEFELKHWETMASCCTGRSAVIPFPQIFGDCNPGPPWHWIKKRQQEGKMTLLNSVHEDNPMLYDEAGNITAQGIRTMAVLDSLTGVRFLRLRKGIWAGAEGAVFDNYDPAIHECERDEKEMVNWFLALDQGFTNPAVILLVGADGDDRWHIFNEWYFTGKLESQIAEQAIVWAKEYGAGVAAVDDAAPSLAAALNKAAAEAEMISWAYLNDEEAIRFAYGGKGDITGGNNRTRDRLKVLADGKPRLTHSKRCVNTRNEFESYVFKTGTDKPEDHDNHSMGALRYLDDVLYGDRQEEYVVNSEEMV